MKITFLVNHPNLSGGQRVIAIYADRLAARGHAVRVIAAGRPAAGRGARLRRMFRGDRPDEPAPSYFGDMRADLILLDHPAPLGPRDVPDGDVVVASWWELAFCVTALPPEKGAKVYFIQHHEVHDHLPSHLSAGSYYLPMTKVTISRWLVETMRDRYGDPDVALVRNSVDTAQFHAPERPRNTTPVVGLLYSGKPFKGVGVSARAIEIARRRFPDLRVVTFGATPLPNGTGLPANTRHHERPPQHTIRDIYSGCDVWLCGSYAEGFHLPPLEAMACRCPVVSTRVGGPDDIIEPGVNGHLVEVGDAEALGARLIDVLSLKDADWRGMSDAALATAERYSWEDATTLFEAALERACAGQPANRTR